MLNSLKQADLWINSKKEKITDNEIKKENAVNFKTAIFHEVQEETSKWNDKRWNKWAHTLTKKHFIYLKIKHLIIPNEIKLIIKQIHFLINQLKISTNK